MGTSTAGDQFRQTELSENVSQLIRSNMPQYWGLHETSGGSRSAEAPPFIQGDIAGDPHMVGNFAAPMAASAGCALLPPCQKRHRSVSRCREAAAKAYLVVARESFLDK